LVVSEFNSNLFRGPRPEKDEDFSQLKKIGIKTILNLEGGMIEAITANSNYQQIASSMLEMETVRFEMNILMPPSYQDVQNALWVMRQSKYLPVYVHCKQGRDRTGYVICAYRLQEQGWDLDPAIKEMYSHKFHYFYAYWLPSLRKFVRPN
jgi:tyrosine-protein phosphatase SIW14